MTASTSGPTDGDLERLRQATWPRAEDVAAARRRAGDAAAHDVAEVAWTLVPSDLGPLLLAATGDGLITLAYGDAEPVLERLARQVSPRIVESPRSLAEPRREVEEHLAGTRRAFAVPLDWRLVRPGFTTRVLRATAALPFGTTATYGEIAAAAGSPRGARAAGQALGSNPLPIVVPCHRVLASDGALGGYTSGVDRKRRLLAIEGIEVA